MFLRICHHDDDAIVVLVPFASGLPAEDADEFDSLVDVVDGDIEMDANLPHLGFHDRLEDESRLRVTAMAQIDPSFVSWPRFASEQRTPELCYALRFEAIDGDTGPDVGHFATLRPGV